MKTIEIDQATGPLGQFARELGPEPLILTRDGQPVAALMPIDGEDLDSIALGSHPRFLAILEQARAEYRDGAGVSEEEARRQLGLS